jgi:hypothetical protein
VFSRLSWPLWGLLLFAAACTEFPTGYLGDDDDASPPGPQDDDDTADACDEFVDEEPGDPDGSCTSIEPYELFEPQMEVMWQWTDPVEEVEHFQVLSLPIVIDLTDDNGDGQYGDGDVPDVVFITMANECYDCDGVMRAVSGADGTELWTDLSGYELPSGFAPAAGELIAASPGPEIVAMTEDEELICYAADGTVLWTTPTGEETSSGSIALHDMDHDGEPEIIYGRRIFGPDGTLHGVGEYGYGQTHSGFPVTYAVDLDGDGLLEVVTGNAAYHKDGSALWHNGEDDGTTAVGDFDLDGDPEIVVSGAGSLRLQDHTGAVIWGPVATLGESTNGAPPTVADFDGDGLPEIGIADKFYYQLYDTDGSLMWSHETIETSSGITGSSVFDFNGDGTAEVVYGDEENFYIFEGSTGTILFQEPAHSSRTNIEYPVIVDVDADGSADIVLTSNSVFEEGDWDAVTALTGVNETGWWQTRRIWNQHAYFVTNVEDDGTIPQFQLNPWEVHNSFRQARPGTGWDGYPVADAVPEIQGLCDAGCPSEMRLLVRVKNAGAVDITAGLPVTLWDDHLNDVLGTVYVPDAIPAGWTSATVEIPYDPHLVPQDAIMVRVDTFSTGLGIHLECDEDNNDALIPDATCP